MKAHLHALHTDGKMAAWTYEAVAGPFVANCTDAHMQATW